MLYPLNQGCIKLYNIYKELFIIIFSYFLITPIFLLTTIAIIFLVIFQYITDFFKINYIYYCFNEIIIFLNLNLNIHKSFSCYNFICTICHDELNNDVFTYKCNCKYYYHYTCLYKWLKINNHCPICKIS